MKISVIIPTRNPNRIRLERTLAGLAAQTFPIGDFEVVLVDNGSAPALSAGEFSRHSIHLRVVREEEPGLTPARLRGIDSATGEILIFVDDDNVLCPDYLAATDEAFLNHPRLGAAGGPVQPEFESAPPAWVSEFFGLLALQDAGPDVKIFAGGAGKPWPEFAPVGAGLCLRASAVAQLLAGVRNDPLRRTLDRRGNALTSGGDNDLVFTLYHAGYDVGYFPRLTLLHLIPASRLEPEYLGRLNEGIQRSWVRVLGIHGQYPWPAIPTWSVSLRSARAWLKTRAWSSAANHIRWRGLRGRFQGQADLSTLKAAQGATQ